MTVIGKIGCRGAKCYREWPVWNYCICPSEKTIGELVKGSKSRNGNKWVYFAVGTIRFAEGLIMRYKGRRNTIEESLDF